MKDFWRTNFKDAKLEGDVLEDLQEKGVECVKPRDVANGDLSMLLINPARLLTPFS